MSYIFDIETLGKESTTVILSAAIVYVDFSGDFTYEELIDNSIFVKFKVNEQLKAGRTYDKDTINWWESRPDDVKKKSITPNDSDVSVIDGLKTLRDYYSKNKSDMIWIRGSLDSLAIDSLASSFKVDPIAPWWNYRDVRTAIDLLKETSKRSYCDIPNFDKSKVIKHDPVHDICYDAFMMKYGI